MLKFGKIRAAIAVTACAASLIFISCDNNKFKVDGDIYGADGEYLRLEKSDFNGQWIALDSAKIDKSGSFSISSEAPVSPEIYRLSLGDRFIYFPIDSVENLHIESSVKDYGVKYTLSGSEQAERMAAFEKELISLSNPDAAALVNFKKDVYSKYIMPGNGSIVSYYVLTKFYDGKPLYDPADPQDAKYYAAVATQFENYRPDDPHGKMVKEVSLAAMRNRNSAMGKKTVISANELKVIDIDLPDETGRQCKLSEMVGKGKPVVLIFSLMNEKVSPTFNRELARIYNSRKGSVEFYHVSLDAGMHEWKEAASNLPWTTVIDPNGTSSGALLDYNVGALPAIFIYNSAGDLTDRVESLSDLEKKI